MSIPTHPISDSPATTPSPAPPAPPRMAPTRPMYWSIRRELWENRSVTLAPLAVAAFVLLIMLSVTAAALPRRVRNLQTVDTPSVHALVGAPFRTVPAPIIVVTILVGLFYCLDALYGERRDRSILFWKSLPVSDAATVLAKASVPLVVLPLYVLGLVVNLQIVLKALTFVAFSRTGGAEAGAWPLLPMWLAELYALLAIAVWHAPLYAWLLFVSGWARRAAFLWAVLPFAVIAAAESGAVHTAHFGRFLGDRLTGWFTRGFNPHGGDPSHPLRSLTPGRLLGAPGLWIGLAVAAALLAATVRFRRERAPI